VEGLPDVTRDAPRQKAARGFTDRSVQGVFVVGIPFDERRMARRMQPQPPAPAGVTGVVASRQGMPAHAG
jgi:hypothetical protein